LYEPPIGELKVIDIGNSASLSHIRVLRDIPTSCTSSKPSRYR